MKIWFCILGIALLAGCSSSPPVSEESPELVGAPPPPEDDPFFFSTMPPDAVQAETSGSIGAPSADEGEPAPEESVKDDASPPAELGSYRCLSCVRICGTSGSDCDEDDDAICGWGVHPDRDTAQSLARAECDGALEEARGSARFRSIEGACPAATCERPR